MAYGPFDGAANRCGAGSTANAASSDPLFFAVVERRHGRAGRRREHDEHRHRDAPARAGAHLVRAGRPSVAGRTRRRPSCCCGPRSTTWGYRRVEWKCDALNARSRAAAERLGFTFEGVFRSHMIVKGRNRDTAWFSMLGRGMAGPAGARCERWLDAPSPGAVSLRDAHRGVRRPLNRAHAAGSVSWCGDRRQPRRRGEVLRLVAGAAGSRPRGAATGARIGIVGPNGAGKSTMLRILQGSETPDRRRGRPAQGSGDRLPRAARRRRRAHRRADRARGAPRHRRARRRDARRGGGARRVPRSSADLARRWTGCSRDSRICSTAGSRPAAPAWRARRGPARLARARRRRPRRCRRSSLSGGQRKLVALAACLIQPARTCCCSTSPRPTSTPIAGRGSKSIVAEFPGRRRHGLARPLPARRDRHADRRARRGPHHDVAGELLAPTPWRRRSR